MARGVSFQKKKAIVLDRLTGAYRKSFQQWTRPSSGGGGADRHFVTLEDFPSNGPCYAKWTTRLGTDAIEVLQIYAFDNILAGAQPPYRCICTLIDGEWCVIHGGCITTCASSGVLSVGTAPDGTEGVAYAGHSVSGSNLNANSFTATGLPAGLSMSTAGAISGTPTTAGTYYVVVQATSPKTGGGGDCTLSKVLPIVIKEAS